MGMVTGGGAGVRSEINVTPLVDVVLVLLIIFMVVTPILQTGYETNIPPEAPDDPSLRPQPQGQILLRMDAEGKLFINKEQISAQDFPIRLSQTLQGRGGRTVFFAANGELQYEKVSEFLDVCRANGAINLSIVLDDIEHDEAAPTAAGP